MGTGLDAVTIIIEWNLFSGMYENDGVHFTLRFTYICLCTFAVSNPGVLIYYLMLICIIYMSVWKKNLKFAVTTAMLLFRHNTSFFFSCFCSLLFVARDTLC